MEVKVTNHDDFINRDEVKAKLRKQAQWLKESAKRISQKYIRIIKQWMQDISDVMDSDIIVKQYDILTKEEIVNLSCQYRVEGSTGVGAYKKYDDKNDMYMLYLTYVKGDELIPRDQNRYIVIQAEGLTREVKEMFKDSDIVVLV